MSDSLSQQFHQTTLGARLHVTENAETDVRLTAFLQENFQDRPQHLDAWKNLILNDHEAKSRLLNALEELDEVNREKRSFLPDRRLILNALTYRPPSEIQAIIVGNDPVPMKHLATGLAFSFPKRPRDGEKKYYDLYQDLDMCFLDTHILEEKKLMERVRRCPGRAVVEMKLALQAAGIETKGDFNYNYEHWAARGVLLLNAFLTVEEETGNGKHDFWRDFTKRLIVLILKEPRTAAVLGMFWGNLAQGVFKAIGSEASLDSEIDLSLFESYTHPTARKQQQPRAFLPNAERQFLIKRELFKPCEDMSLQKNTSDNDESCDKEKGEENTSENEKSCDKEKGEENTSENDESCDKEKGEENTSENEESCDKEKGEENTSENEELCDKEKGEENTSENEELCDKEKGEDNTSENYESGRMRDESGTYESEESNVTEEEEEDYELPESEEAYNLEGVELLPFENEKPYDCEEGYDMHNNVMIKTPYYEPFHDDTGNIDATRMSMKSHVISHSIESGHLKTTHNGNTNATRKRKGNDVFEESNKTMRLDVSSPYDDTIFTINPFHVESFYGDDSDFM